MCRFVMYLGEDITMSSLVTEPTNSIIHQSYANQERVEPLNGDGFGVAWYVPSISEDPAVIRSVSPAWSNANLASLARVVRSQCILAHIRAATPGLPVTQLNCHPFVSGPLAFMHNGFIPQFRRVRRPLLQRLSQSAFDGIDGSTDSEHAFALFQDRHRNIVGTGHASPESLADALSATITDINTLLSEAGIEEPAFLNLAVTDGRVAAISRYVSGGPLDANSLYSHTGRRYVCENGVCRMVEPDAAHTAVIVASERLSDDPGWDRTPANSILLVHADRTVTTRPA